ncbi:hypothetical protein O6H91_08G059300 [Diphasiastrum complanatum]|uniref:Uncharacterized protein n=1 Tax=Diphasiastrum complanatum TaxID=34168 RepID=A0ACC2CXW6_DIPCM|nr:hypothetical protein O6H91_08G059300 [Diphasiastrum complanatum]
MLLERHTNDGGLTFDRFSISVFTNCSSWKSAVHGLSSSASLHRFSHQYFSITAFPSALFSVFPNVFTLGMLQIAGPLLINQLECAGNKPFRFTKKLFTLEKSFTGLEKWERQFLGGERSPAPICSIPFWPERFYGSMQLL